MPYLRFRFTLRSLFLYVTTVAMILIFWQTCGAYRSFTFHATALVGLFVIFIVSRIPAVAIACLTYLVVFSVAWLLSEEDAVRKGTFVRQFNEHLLQVATDEKLVGSDQQMVEEVLGPATSVWGDKYNGGMCVYSYYPYAYNPVAKFEVVCRDHKVVRVLTFED